jgi:glycosyltransferase involved in cell wall biosynthesis
MDRIIRDGSRECRILKEASIEARKVQLSVVIPSYNTAEFIQAAIRSVTEQTFGGLEIIVVDDGSSDDSIQRIMALDDERLTCVYQENRGLAGARNTGILLARGEFIGFLDADDIWYPQKAETHLRVMQVDPKIGLTFSYSAYLDEAGSETGRET